MDILEILKRDHEHALLLLDELDQIKDKGGKKHYRHDRLFNQLRQELELHMMGEEEVFYPVLSGNEHLHPIVLEAVEEHRLIRLLLTEIGRLPKGEQWAAKISVLREEVEHHIEDEEDDIFDNAEDLIESEQRSIMANRIMEIKEQHMAAIVR